MEKYVVIVKNLNNQFKTTLIGPYGKDRAENILKKLTQKLDDNKYFVTMRSLWKESDVEWLIERCNEEV